MADDKIQISWTDLKTSKVEKYLRQQQAMLRNRRYSQMTGGDVPVAQGHWPIWYNPIFLLTAFGLLGGLLAWSGGALMHLTPDRRQQADQALASIADIGKMVQTSPHGYGITRQQADDAIHDIVLNAGNNPYLKIEMETSFGAPEKQSRLDKVAQADHWKDLITHILGFGIAGVIISICLSVAEPVIDRNLHAAVINGSVGAALGLAGGLAASLVVDPLYRAFGGAGHGLLREYLAQSVSWAVLGAFLAAAPALVLKNRKRLLIGLAGGAIGGAVGGILLDPLSQVTSSAEFGRLAALCCIGAVAGAATGFLEYAARTGWLKVTAGAIAGKQFILYRDPTYIGSAPDCQIYLFRDPKVGRRHAAIHLLKGRIEIEDLPLGGQTLINGKPVFRQRLCHGDRIAIGSTTFLFQEKKASANSSGNTDD
jgi:hypothetical protein